MMRLFRPKERVIQSEFPLFLYNTLGSELQEFTLPPHVRTVRMYNCGPTVYGVQHIGNLGMFVFADVLRRTLEYNGFPVKQVINITDFGHLSGDNEGDADHGEDRMTKGLKREGMKVTMENMAILAGRYTEIFLDNIRQLNIDTGRITFPRASEYIGQQIAMIKTLEEKGYAYQTTDGVYFDTARFPSYGALGGINLENQREGARVALNAEKHSPSDFILWKSDAALGWDSPWGMGFPGWHIECSAMIRSCLGEQIDIHTGGIEHIPIHHNNEIAQSEAATGKKPFSRFWLHRAHIQIEGSKIAKSGGNVVYLSEIIERGFHPIALRYLFLGAHYRSSSNFSWEALAASQTAFIKLLTLTLSLKDAPSMPIPQQWQKKYMERINDDLDTPGALGVVWEMTKDKTLSPGELLAGLLDIDQILGLNLKDPDDKAREIAQAEIKEEISIDALPEDVRLLLRERDEARQDSRWDHADTLRAQIADLGFLIEDNSNTPRIFKR